MGDINASVVTWLLHHPLQRDSDLALAFQVHPTTIYRHLTRLVEEGLVEYLSPSGETNRQRLYYLTQAGLLAAAEQQAASPAALARMWGADEAGLLRLLPRLTTLMTIQNVINGLLAHAPDILAYPNGTRASLSWHWRRDWQHRFVSRGRIARCRADAVLLFHRSPQLKSAGPGEYYPLLLLADGGLNGMNDRLIVEQRLEQLLRYRESEERIEQYGQFPPIVIVVRDQHQQEHWQHTMQEISQSLRLDPLRGALVCVSPDQAIASAWTLPWQQLESQAPCRLQDQLVPNSLDALPLELFAPIAENKGAERKRRLIQGHYAQRASQLKCGTPTPHSSIALLGVQLSHHQMALLTLLYAAPLLSADEVAAFWDVTQPTAARALYELQQAGCIEQQGLEGGRRWRLCSSGLRLMAALLQVSLQHIADGTGKKMIQRGLPTFSRSIRHTAGVYRFLAQLHRAAREQGHHVVWWETGGWCERRYHDHGTWHNLRPDATLEYVAGTRHIRAWLEWDEGTMTGGALATKMHTYAYYVRSREWAKEMRPLPTLLIIAPEPGQEMRIRHLARACIAARLLVQTTTVRRLTEDGPLAPIWLPQRRRIAMQQRRAEHIRRELIRLCHAGLDSRTLRIELLKRLRTVIPLDLSFFSTTDPATLLFTGAVVDEVLARATPQFIENEFFQEDVNKCAWMARNKTSVVNLVQATGGELERSQRYREILAPLALGDELRAVLITGGTCWGFMCLHRDQGSPHFSLAEAAYLARLTPHFAEGLRTALLLGSPRGPTAPDEPGVLLLADDLSAVATTPTAERWLAEVGEADWPRKRAVPYAVSAVVGRMLALERGMDSEADLTPRVRLRTASGHWLVLHASRLSGGQAQGQIAVIVEVARPAEVAPLLVQAYDLSKRESEILQLVVRGHSTAEISEAFHISSNTVQDHLKAIFEKVGVRSRRELVGQLFAQHYQPPIAAGRSLDRNGWFTD